MQDRLSTRRLKKAKPWMVDFSSAKTSSTTSSCSSSSSSSAVIRKTSSWKQQMQERKAVFHNIAVPEKPFDEEDDSVSTAKTSRSSSHHTTTNNQNNNGGVVEAVPPPTPAEPVVRVSKLEEYLSREQDDDEDEVEDPIVQEEEEDTEDDVDDEEAELPSLGLMEEDELLPSPQKSRGVDDIEEDSEEDEEEEEDDSDEDSDDDSEDLASLGWTPSGTTEKHDPLEEFDEEGVVEPSDPHDESSSPSSSSPLSQQDKDEDETSRYLETIRRSVEAKMEHYRQSQLLAAQDLTVETTTVPRVGQTLSTWQEEASTPVTIPDTPNSVRSRSCDKDLSKGSLQQQEEEPEQDEPQEAAAAENHERNDDMNLVDDDENLPPGTVEWTESVLTDATTTKDVMTTNDATTTDTLTHRKSLLMSEMVQRLEPMDTNHYPVVETVAGESPPRPPVVLTPTIVSPTSGGKEFLGELSKRVSSLSTSHHHVVVTNEQVEQVDEEQEQEDTLVEPEDQVEEDPSEPQVSSQERTTSDSLVKDDPQDAEPAPSEPTEQDAEPAPSEPTKEEPHKEQEQEEPQNDKNVVPTTEEEAKVQEKMAEFHKQMESSFVAFESLLKTNDFTADDASVWTERTVQEETVLNDSFGSSAGVTTTSLLNTNNTLVIEDLPAANVEARKQQTAAAFQEQMHKSFGMFEKIIREQDHDDASIWTEYTIGQAERSERLVMESCHEDDKKNASFQEQMRHSFMAFERLLAQKGNDDDASCWTEYTMPRGASADDDEAPSSTCSLAQHLEQHTPASKEALRASFQEQMRASFQAFESVLEAKQAAAAAAEEEEEEDASIWEECTVALDTSALVGEVLPTVDTTRPLPEDAHQAPTPLASGSLVQDQNSKPLPTTEDIIQTPKPTTSRPEIKKSPSFLDQMKNSFTAFDALIKGMTPSKDEGDDKEQGNEDEDDDDDQSWAEYTVGNSVACDGRAHFDPRVIPMRRNGPNERSSLTTLDTQANTSLERYHECETFSEDSSSNDNKEKEPSSSKEDPPPEAQMQVLNELAFLGMMLPMPQASASKAEPNDIQARQEAPAPSQVLKEEPAEPVESSSKAPKEEPAKPLTSDEALVSSNDDAGKLEVAPQSPPNARPLAPPVLDAPISPFKSSLLNSRMFSALPFMSTGMDPSPHPVIYLNGQGHEDVDDDMTAITFDHTMAEEPLPPPLPPQPTMTPPLYRDSPVTTASSKKTAVTDEDASAHSQSAHSRGASSRSSESSKHIAEILRRDIWSPDTAVIQSALERLADVAGLGRHQRVNISRMGGVLAILRAMEMNRHHAGVQAASCRALACMAAEAETQLDIAEMDGIAVTVAAMQEFPNDEPVQEGACRTLLQLTRYQESPEPIVADGVVPVLVAAMMQHGLNVKIQETAFGALANLCLDNRERLQELSQAGGLTTMTIALQKPWENKTAKHEAISNLSILLRGLADCEQ